MASIDALSPVTTTQAATSPSTVAASSAQSQQNEFLQLLVAQLQSQNPLDPMDGTQFVSQLAQFSSLQELTAMHNDPNNIQTYLQPASTGTAASPASSSSASSSSKDSSSNPFQIA
jgi:flagellar basal-body rod modification protein FlgD